MASTQGDGPSSSEGTTIGDLQGKLYTKCLEDFASTKLILQRDLLNLKIIPDDSVEILIQCIQGLINQNLFKVHTTGDRIGWKVVKEQDAAKYSNLSTEERILYGVIESNGTSGIWTKHIKTRTNLHQTIVTRCLKSLENKSLIKTVRNVKHPQQKTYMLSGLQPNEEVTGGAWFTDGQLDEALIRDLGNYIAKWVADRSWIASTATDKVDVETGNKRKLTGVEDDRNGKRKAFETENDEKKYKQVDRKTAKMYLPYPPGYNGYPTVMDVTNAILRSKAIDLEIGQHTVRQLLDVLCFDGRLVKVGDRQSYKSLRTPDKLEMGDEETSLTEAPCGRCPVFNLCEEGGPINAGNCEYFQGWLEMF